MYRYVSNEHSANLIRTLRFARKGLCHPTPSPTIVVTHHLCRLDTLGSSRASDSRRRLCIFFLRHTTTVGLCVNPSEISLKCLCFLILLQCVALLSESHTSRGRMMCVLCGAGQVTQVTCGSVYWNMTVFRMYLPPMQARPRRDVSGLIIIVYLLWWATCGACRV